MEYALDGGPGRYRQGRGGLIWADHQLKAWKVDTFKISNDPRFEEKLVDVVGLYMNIPMLVIAVALVATGVASPGFLLVALACTAMMAMMMRGMHNR